MVAEDTGCLAGQMKRVSPAPPAGDRVYDMREIAGPRVVGKTPLAFLRTLAESPATRSLSYRLVAAPQNNFSKFLKLALLEEPKRSGVPDGPVALEKDAAPVPNAGSPAARVRAALAALDGSDGGVAGAVISDAGARPTILDYHAAFKSGAASPADVAEAIIAFLASEAGAANWVYDLDPAHLRAQAAASATRFAAGAPLSVLDGVPFAVKDHIPAFATRTFQGTTFLGNINGPVAEIAREAPSVAALRSLGAIFVGKTQMQEFGLLPTGISSKAGVARNPHSRRHTAGGSSGGNGCVVAAGLVAFAIGTDGGGSIRIPAAVCGIVGLKPTQGRMASHPHDSSMSTYGPMAGCVEDTLIAYAAMACPGSCCLSPLPGTADGAAADEGALLGARTAEGAPWCPPQAWPPLTLPARILPEVSDADGRDALFKDRPLDGLRVGVFEPWFEDCDAAVAAAAREGVDLLARLGADVVPVTLPELEQLRTAHSATFMWEALGGTVCGAVWNDLGLRSMLHDDTRIVLATASNLTEAHYEQAQRVRRRQSDHWARAFEACDVIATPTVACLGIEIARGAETGGMLALKQTSRLTRYTIAANVVGLPALALPLGTAVCPSTRARLPTSLQLMGRPWHDATLLRVGAVLEAALRAGGSPAPLPPLVMPNPLAAQKKF